MKDDTDSLSKVGGDCLLESLIDANGSIVSPSESFRKFQAMVLDQVNDAILVRDLEDRIVFWNKGAERLYGWNAAEAMGERIYELLCQKHLGICGDAEIALGERGEWKGEMRQVARDGRDLIVESHWKLILDKADRPKAVLIVNTDVTEKKMIEHQFLRSQRLETAGKLAGGIVHDLNSVLPPILIAAQLLRQKDIDPESRRWLDTLCIGAEQVGQLLTQLLSFARGIEGVNNQIEAGRLIRETVALLAPAFPKSIKIKVVIADDLWTVVGNATEVHQVLMNLCVNARDAMVDGGVLTIRSKNLIVDRIRPAGMREAEPGRYVLIRLSDTGVGIPSEIIGKIFDPFFTTKEGKGTGLGLTTVKTIVKANKGFIDVVSRRGKGTEFRVYLPVREPLQVTDTKQLSRRKSPETRSSCATR